MSTNFTARRARNNPDFDHLAAVILCDDRELVEIYSEQVQHGDLLESLANELEDRNVKVRITFRNLLSQQQDIATKLLEWASTLTCIESVVVDHRAAQQQSREIQDAVLWLLGRAASPAEQQRAIQLSLLVASLARDLDPAIASSQVLSAARKAGVRGLRASEFRATIMALRAKSDRSSDLHAEQSLAKQVLASFEPQSVEDGKALPPDESGLPGLILHDGNYFRWTGTCWVSVSTSDLRLLIVRRLRDLTGEETRTRQVSDVLENVSALAHVDCQDSLPMLLSIGGDGLSASPSPFFALANGLVDIGELSDHSGEGFYPVSRRHLGLTEVNYTYDARATCPQFRQFLRDIFVRPEDLDRGQVDNRFQIVQEIFGWCLLRDYRELQKFVILVGRGANGKSLLLEILTEMLGRRNVSHVAYDQLGSDFRPAEIDGKLANISSDMNRIERSAEGLLKSMAAGEYVQFNRKHLAAHSSRATAKLIFATNALPQISDRSDGVWRRMIVVPFLRQFLGRDADPSLLGRLKSELPGIFNFAVQGLRRLRGNGQFTQCDVCTAALASHREASDPIGSFVAEHCVLSDTARVETTSLYSDYRGWAVRNGYQPLNSSNFGRRLLQIPGVARARQSSPPRRWLYVGISLRSPEWVFTGSRRRRGLPA